MAGGSSARADFLSTVTQQPEALSVANGTDVTLAANQLSVDITSTGGTVTVNLLAAEQMKDKIVVVYAADQSAGNITVALPGTGAANVSLTADDDYAVCYSDGRRWYVFDSVST